MHDLFAAMIIPAIVREANLATSKQCDRVAEAGRMHVDCGEVRGPPVRSGCGSFATVASPALRLLL